MTEIDYVFCDHCIKDITKVKKFKAYKIHIFCSKQCRDDFYNEEIKISDMFKREECSQCDGKFTKERLLWFNLGGNGLCSENCMAGYQRCHLRYNDEPLIKSWRLNYCYL